MYVIGYHAWLLCVLCKCKYSKCSARRETKIFIKN
ncbi:Uncharacterised protein [Serratia quinivorans]|nr:Uncharacterised protein [Serratia quinivorans]CAI2159951.1 Uncharacterised protein [Serratia quinivorans]